MENVWIQRSEKVERLRVSVFVFAHVECKEVEFIVYQREQLPDQGIVAGKN